MKIIEGKEQRPRRIMMMGIHGVGKSTWAASAPQTIFVPTEEGLNDVDCHKYPLALEYDEVMANLKDVYEGKYAYKTLAVDSVDWLEKLIWAEVCKANNVRNIEEIGYQRGFRLAMDWWRRFIDALDAIRQEKRMTIILIAHAQVAKWDDPELESYSRWIPALHKHAAELLTEWVDEILFATFRTYVKTDDKGFNQKRVRGVGQGERIIKTTERPGHVAKNRLGLPDEIPLSWNEYAKYLEPAKAKDNGKKPKIEKPEPKKEEVKHG